MHGLINRSFQNFISDVYGSEAWLRVAALAGVSPPEFEAMLSYDDVITSDLLKAMSSVLRRPSGDVMEDIGAYLVSHPNTEAIRRLLRFGGTTFEEFLHSLDDLPDRARMAVAELCLPAIELHAHSKGNYSLICDSPMEGFGHFMMGVLRVMADDYGALALLDLEERTQGRETVRIQLVATDFADGRSFELGAGAR
ncbi:heme NO-binding domain-containing protein [Sulfitobacter donghicola]|uniref:Heme NO binding domain-containing protein n=1 Tax=Sulfitobacter donghicola DSW-25 = KCTC 12864 = JCM 14565 TaxID=1300350 RepID=A0A073IV28_9RHOB|nr:heme NO-binding domain-containing protein [Sulfitobacter donghicola]KEJ89247.1 heme NO binding domain-containing protein [Sulfitobacter donghicola DSW-25 = KCTC 12864 = JCM 14565]KIN69042.1 Heme NO binding domain protein [Sulfitobacter donghicola DSW-25 = KCTC 12864 = JCM 14565]